MILKPGEIADALEAAQGHPIELVEGAYTLSRPVKITVPTTVRGAGRWFTKITAQNGGFHNLAHFKLSGVTLERADHLTDVPVYGVHAEAWVSVEECEIAGYTNGVHIESSADTNVNGWRLNDLLIKGSGHAGIYVRGGDANCGLAAGVRVYTSCEHDVDFPALGTAAGIVDRSYLGNTWIGCLVASSGCVDKASGKIVQRPSYLLEGNSQHSILIGPYRERDQAPAKFSQYTTSLGGFSPEWEGSGMRLDGPYVTALVVRNTKDPSNIVEVRMGNIAASGTFMELRSQAIDLSRPLRIKARPSDRSYFLDVANQLKVAHLAQDTGLWTIG